MALLRQTKWPTELKIEKTLNNISGRKAGSNSKQFHTNAPHKAPK